MIEVLSFTCGGLTALLLWWLVLGPLFHGFIQGLMGAESVPHDPEFAEPRSD